ncbi:uncharacterized protein J4E88_007219 [Alternaria novae-zelandiae]|uniref:uncharacterized protein n=1 Tax=Alternaria novae-zelandiae TaxID=430562 RepID=UPI0020C2D09F|nr:uncharacterized protein J4E88_007219 [Alternaria novae-zelandiae]KAI4676305.1 hypothetical protein J4E88_007219 [Alternaria novae-zelandiae]
MSCWRVLELSEQPDGKQIPQLLIKPAFDLDSYTVHLTDLSNIWSEELSVDDIVKRAALEQSPIEVSKHDAAQVAILLENVKKPLLSAEGSICLPEPLGRLTWKFHLEKRTSADLKNELILPLLVSSHIQNERITGLILTIAAKDKAMTRLVDQFDSHGLDLAAAFPSAGGIKAGRRKVKREQAEKHVPALRFFHEEAWRHDTEQLKDTNLTTLGLFQEALAQSTPTVPSELKSGHFETTWWTAVPTQLSMPKAPVKTKAKTPPVASKPAKAAMDSGDETEEEFETHVNFKTRELGKRPTQTPAPLPSSPLDKASETEDDSTEDDEDLDAPPKSQSQSLSRTPQKPTRRRTPTPEPRSAPKAPTLPVQKPKASSFRIGGKSKRSTESPPPSPKPADVEPEPEVLPTRESVPPSQPSQATTPKKIRKPFRIGGKGKKAEDGASQRDTTASPSTQRFRATQSPTADPPSSPPRMKEMTPVEEVHEETPEEKAERKRAELKRKNEEAAKKQAHAKKKKRF